MTPGRLPEGGESDTECELAKAREEERRDLNLPRGGREPGILEEDQTCVWHEGDGQMVRVGEHGDWLDGSQTPPLNDLPTNFLPLLGLVSLVVRAWPWAMPLAQGCLPLL